MITRYNPAQPPTLRFGTTDPELKGSQRRNFNRDIDRFVAIRPKEAPKNIPHALRHLLEDIYKLPRMSEVILHLNESVPQIPGLKKKDHLHFTFGDYNIQIMQREYANGVVNSLRSIKDLNLSCAPRLIQHVRVDSIYSLVITEQPGRANLVPYKDLKVGLPAASKDKFRDEMKTLARNGLVHRYGAKGREHWLVNPASREIVLDAWESLSRLSAMPRNYDPASKFEQLLYGKKQS